MKCKKGQIRIKSSGLKSVLACFWLNFTVKQSENAKKAAGAFLNVKRLLLPFVAAFKHLSNVPSLLGVVLAVFFAGLLASTALAEPILVTSGATSDPAGQRKIFYDATFGRYWLFYRTATGDAAYKTFDGANVSSTQQSIFLNDTSGLVSIWYDPLKHIVYAISGVKVTGTAFYVVAGHIPDACAGTSNPNVDCKIKWGTELSLTPVQANCWGGNKDAYTAGSYPAATYPMGGSIAQSQDEKLIAAVGAKHATAGTLNWGTIGQYGITPNTSNLENITLTAGTVFASCFAALDSGSGGVSEVFASVVPVGDMTTTGIVAFRDSNDGTNTNAPAMAASKVPGTSLPAKSAYNATVERAYNVSTNNVGTNAAATAGTGPEGNGWSMAIASSDSVKLSTVVVHAAYVSGDATNSGDLMYVRRSTGPGSTATGTWGTPFLLDGSGTNPGGTRIRFPSIVYVRVDGTSANDRVYVFYVDATGGISYMGGPTATTSSATWSGPTQLVTAGNHPQVPAYAESPYPMTLLYEGDAGLSVELVPISPYAEPKMAWVQITTNPTSAPYSTNQYTLRLTSTNAAGFLNYPDGDPNGVPVATILKGGNEQSYITAGKVSLVGASYAANRYSAIDIPITLHPGAGFDAGPYDIKITNVDGRSSTTVNAFTIPVPQVSSVTDPQGDNFTSGAGFPVNSATGSTYRNITVVGKGFMNWNFTSGTGTVCAAIDSPPGSRVDGVTVSTCTNITAQSPELGNSTFTAKLKISTAAAAGVYYVRVINPTLQEGFYGSPSTTFYLTLTTASINYPSTTDGLKQIDELNWGTTGFNLINGGQTLWPNDGQAYSDTTTYTTQLKIERVYDGYYFNGADTVRDFRAPTSFTSEEKYWFSIKSSGTWFYNADDTTKWGNNPTPSNNGWPLVDGEYQLSARGQTSDQPAAWIGGAEYGPIPFMVDRRQPGVTIAQPLKNTAWNNTANPTLQIQTNDSFGIGGSGSGVQKVWFSIMTSSRPTRTSASTSTYLNDVSTAGWVSWCHTTMNNCSNDHSGGASGNGFWGWNDTPGVRIWISTGSTYNPPLQWDGADRKVFTTTSEMYNSGNYDVKIPTWTDGKDYYIVAAASDTVNLFGTSESTSAITSWGDIALSTSSGYRFVYDITIPTITATSSLISISTDSAYPTWLKSITLASGTVADNVLYRHYIDMDPRYVYLRIRNTYSGGSKCLNPSSHVDFDQSDCSGAWWRKDDGLTGNWQFDFPYANFTSGKSYDLEIYGIDGAGNADPDSLTQCLSFYNSTTTLGCQTGNAAMPKYHRYFNFDSNVPLVAITSPAALSGTNYVGGVLSQLAGTAADYSTSESGVAKVNYKLQYNDGNDIKYWQAPGWAYAEAWSTAAYDASQGSWTITNVSTANFVDGAQYILTVYAEDNAGNAPTSYKTITFTYDTKPPVSRIISPSGGAMGSTRITAISGTVTDEVSTAAPSGLDGNLYIAVKRQSGNYWWDYVNSTWTYSDGISFSTLTIGSGSGVKSWSMSIPTTFYDLLPGTTDTFYVYTWAKDRLNNPTTAYANIEDYSNYKVMFSYQASTPILTAVYPGVESARSDVSSVTFSLSPEGGRIKQVYVAFLSTGNTGEYTNYWAGGGAAGGWTAGAVDPPSTSPFGAVWLSTDTAAGGSPDMIFTPGTATDGRSALSVEFKGNTTISTPTWSDGMKYKIYLAAVNTAGQTLFNYGPGISSHTFVYDVTAPTVLVTPAIAAWSDNSDIYTGINSLAVASGTITDNIYDTLSQRHVYVRIADLTNTGQPVYLNPSNFGFNIVEGGKNSAWNDIKPSSGTQAWSLNLSQVNWTNGNSYSMEIWGTDGAGNVNGNSGRNPDVYGVGQAKYTKYFAYDNVKPQVVISTPYAVDTTLIYGKDKDGSSILSTIRGEPYDDPGDGLSISSVTFALQYRAGGVTYRWDLGAWRTTLSSDAWNLADNINDWTEWEYSGIDWRDSQSYTLKVKAIDKAGNISDAASISFIYDVSPPVSAVISPANGQVLTSYSSGISGTSIDRISTYTPSGLGSNFYVGIQRTSDSNWWDVNLGTWTVNRSTRNAGIDAGTGIKTWTLALDATFYDLVSVGYDTFTVYAYGVDQVNYPAASYANIGSSLTALSTYYFQSSPPSASVTWPKAGSAQSTVSSVTLTVSPGSGTGVKQVWAVFIDTTPTSEGKYWDGHAWQPLGSHNPGDVNDSVWLTTDSVTGPDMIYRPFLTQANSEVVFTELTDISSPAWVDGSLNKIFVKGVNGVGQLAISTASGYQFVYDHTAPSVTVSPTIDGLSDDFNNPTWFNSVSVATGTITDNIYDPLNQRHVYVRIAEVTAGEQSGVYLNPANSSFELSEIDKNLAWNDIRPSSAATNWTYTLSGANWSGGGKYRMEVWGTDGAGNVDGNSGRNPDVYGAGQAKYTKYFVYDNVKPEVTISTPNAGDTTLIYGRNTDGSSILSTIRGEPSDNFPAGVSSVTFALQYRAGGVTYRWDLGAWRTTISSDAWNLADNISGWTQWEYSGIDWRDSQVYTLKVKAVDKAGNVSEVQSVTFTYDVTPPVSAVISPANGRILTSYFDSISGTSRDQVATATTAPSGLGSNFYVGIQRVSDSNWWDVDAGTWTVNRSTKNVGTDAGTGVQTWSLALDATFYDLVKVGYDTFTVYAYGVDQVNYPGVSYANIGSSLTAVSTYYFQSSPPSASVTWPAAGSAQSTVSSVTLTVSPGSGTGVKQVWAVFIDTTPTGEGKYWDGHAWQLLGSHNPGDVNDSIWLTTNSVTGPDMIYTPFLTQANSEIVFTNLTDISSPAWVDGSLNKIFVKGINGIGQLAISTASGYQFVYDHTAPSVTVSPIIDNFSTDFNNPTWFSSISVATGTITDNIYDPLNQRHIYVRIADVTAGEQSGMYLNPTNFSFELSENDKNLAWTDIKPSSAVTNWSYSLTGVNWTGGDKYRLEVWGTDGAGNTDVNSGSNPDNPGGAAKYTRYFIYDNVKPEVTISTPNAGDTALIYGRDKDGSSILSTIRGVPSDNSPAGVSSVTFALQYRAGGVTYRWDLGAWRTTISSDAWNLADNIGGWTQWAYSGIDWSDSQSYTLKVRAVDRAGNISDAQSVTFTYDVTPPVSAVVSPANGRILTSYFDSISGTSRDQVATATTIPSGLGSDFYVGIQRVSDSNWWDVSAGTWTVYRSTKNVGIDAGTGVKTWSLALDATFYDLVKVSYDTFTVYAYGVDQVNYPGVSYANIGSSLAPVSTYYFQSSPPSVSVTWPSAGSAQSSVSSVTLTVSPGSGTGVKQVWAVFIDTTPSGTGKYWDGHAWQLLGSHDPGDVNDSMWLTTNSVTGPDMVYAPFLTQANSEVVFTNLTDISSPAWVDGSVNKIFVRAVNGVGQLAISTATGYQFVYDYTAPSVAVSPIINDWSGDFNNPTWLNSLSVATGTITDNVYDPLNQRHVYVRIANVTVGEQAGVYLNPANFSFELSENSKNLAWNDIKPSSAATNWGYSLSLVSWTNGDKYRLEVWGTDGAGNVDGNSGRNPDVYGAGQAKYTKYFIYDSVKPEVVISTPNAVDTTLIYGRNKDGSSILSTIRGEPYDDPDDGLSISSVTFALQYRAGGVTYRWDLGAWRTTISSDAWNLADNISNWTQWAYSGVDWRDSQNYTLKVRAIDKAGNISEAQSVTFTYDASPPVSAVVSPANGQVLTSYSNIISGTSVDRISTYTPSGLGTDFYVGVQRVSDSNWWDVNLGTWTVNRSTKNVGIDAGTGIKTWSLALDATFYDLVSVGYDTFTVYAYGVDQVNYPAA
ncbi:MAG TPA: hypothetical protein DCL44_05395, partial [Elusimicrobia bacterium]|nr:hypothetical protein [Elusimicrobiota bacterium]